MDKKQAVENAFEKVRAEGIPESLVGVHAWANSAELKKAFDGKEMAFIAWLKENDTPIPAAQAKPTKPEKDLGVSKEQFAAVVNKPAAPKLSPVQAYENLLEAHISAGLSRGAAYEKISKEAPQIHSMFLNAVNQQPETKPEKKEPTAFESLVDAHMKRENCSRGDAVSHIARTNPAEHEAYIQGVNS